MKTSRFHLTLALAGALSFTSCEMLEGTTNESIVTTLNTVSQLASAAAAFTADGGDSDGLMKKIGDSSQQAGGLRTKLMVAVDTLAPEYKTTLAPIIDGLAALTGKEEQQLKQLDPAQRKQASKQFSMDAQTLVPLITTALTQLEAMNEAKKEG